jgi:hypothetical protein
VAVINALLEAARVGRPVKLDFGSL